MELKLIPIIIFIVIFLWWILKNETMDTMCKAGCPSFNKQDCFEGNSKYFSNGKYRANDTLETIFRKIEYLNTYTNRIVTWRRCFIVSLIITSLISLFIERVPMHLFAIFIIAFISIQGMLSFYQFHLDVYPQGYMQENVNALRKRLNQPRDPILNDDIRNTVAHISGKAPQ